MLGREGGGERWGKKGMKKNMCEETGGGDSIRCPIGRGGDREKNNLLL